MHARYVNDLSIPATAAVIASASGSLGSCSAYFQSTLDSLAPLGIKDAGMERLRLALTAMT